MVRDGATVGNDSERGWDGGGDGGCWVVGDGVVGGGGSGWGGEEGLVGGCCVVGGMRC